MLKFIEIMWHRPKMFRYAPKLIWRKEFSLFGQKHFWLIANITNFEGIIVKLISPALHTLSIKWPHNKRIIINNDLMIISR